MPGRQTKGRKLTVENPMKVLARVIKYVARHYRIHMIAVFIMIIIAVVANVQGVMFTKSLIDDYIMPMIGQPNPDFAPLLKAIARVVVFYACGIIATFGYNYIMVFVTQGTLRDLRDDLFSHMESLPIRYFDTHPHGDIMSVYTNDVDTLRQLIGQSIPMILNSAITIVSSFVSMLILDIPLTVLTAVMIFIMLFTTSKIAAKSAFYFGRQQQAIGAVNGYIEEMMNGQKVVKVFCHEDKSLEQFRVLNEKLRESAEQANTFANVSMPINNNLGNISYVLCAICGAILALGGYTGLTLGGLVSFLTLNKNISQPFGQISQQLNSVVMAMAGAARIFNLMDETPEEDDGCVELINAHEARDGHLEECKERSGIWAWKNPMSADHSASYTKLEGDVRFENVDFGYTPEKTVLHDVTLFAKPGQKIAFVGSTGAGKTTITNLINRFYDITKGSITYDGIDISKICKSDLRRSLGMVLQDTHLFTGTVMDNIRYGRLDASDEECIAAAKLANADKFIRRLPDGYQTILTGDGGNLSQGQRQLLSIARAAVADPPVLILDEATSSIDTRTEALVQEGMDRLMAGRTTFVIAHRLSTVKNSDCIMVLEQGRIIERGTHDQLIDEKGRYYQLYTGNAIGA